MKTFEKDKNETQATTRMKKIMDSICLKTKE